VNGFTPAERLRGIEPSAIRRFFESAPPGSINLGLGEPDLPTPDVIKRAAITAIENERNGYTSHAGLSELREHVAAQYPAVKGRGAVVITAGAEEALYLALMTLVEEGDEVLLPDPGFVAYPAIVRLAGGTPVFYRLPADRDFAFDPDVFRRRLSPRTKAVVCGSPANPTGRVLTEADLTALADALRDTTVRVIADEVYRELYFGDARPPSVSDFYSRTLVTGGLSKSMSMTGWRLGWLCGEEPVVAAARLLHGYVTTCASTISQKAALGAFTHEGAQARAEARRIFRARRDRLMTLLADAGMRAVVPEGAFYAMVDVRRWGPSFDVAETMLRHGVITVPGSAFGAQGEGFLRVSFCLADEGLGEGVRRMAQALSE
jgi:aspartate/methionine/tyrosine aminotransferase